MTLTMNPQIRKDWCKALRSKEYKQGSGVLRSTTNEWCCLGVLCDIVESTRWEQHEDISDNWFYDGQFEIPEQDDFITKQSGLDVDTMTVLATMNDGGDDFDTIATWLEKNL